MDIFKAHFRTLFGMFQYLYILTLIPLNTRIKVSAMVEGLQKNFKQFGRSSVQTWLKTFCFSIFLKNIVLTTLYFDTSKLNF